jgi:hypothetical protein
MSESSHSIHQRRHPYLPGLWLAAGFLGLASIAFLLRPLGVTPSTITQSAAKVRLEKLSKLRTEQDSAVTTYGWVDKPKGVAHIPIAQAIELIIPQLRSNPPRPAYPITTIQPSAISAAGAPLYPGVPTTEPSPVSPAAKADGATPAPSPSAVKK